MHPLGDVLIVLIQTTFPIISAIQILSFVAEINRTTMAGAGRLIHAGTQEALLYRVRWCSSFVCKLRGLMFRRSLLPGEGLLMVESSASRMGAAIHMLFVFFPIAVVWMDDEFRVVDMAYARPWRILYAPARAARYTLEAEPALLNHVQVGDILRYEEQS